MKLNKHILSTLFASAVLISTSAYSFEYYTNGGLMFIKSFRDSSGNIRYWGCGPTQCLSLNNKSKSEARSMIEGAGDFKGTWEYRGDYGQCEVWVSKVKQGNYPSLKTVMSKLQEKC
ncbi:hypothetical protein [Vibrio furnissii]|uniref:hypothetical protein n=1 Tax=Vibrio furnissii TaxID=29494 RepID=UPI000DFC7C1A|nr:hypothetical protein [Vibrio furnissii]QDC92984.1 hypothetical protein FIU11_09795 [Vibrio furnissii]UON48389.1 hypothetical protein IUJ52_01220 [Vibrio furnissii]SUP45381.1 Uncharacterised protein [Vibrio furnissii]